MGELIDTSTWRYAVIGVRSEPFLDRFVIAYPDEDTLLDLIAASSIVAFGHASRADALKNIDRCVTTTAYVKRPLKAAVLLDTNTTFLTECRVVLRRLAAGFGVSGTSRIMLNLLHKGLASALICFYSKNVLSRTVRAFISF